MESNRQSQISYFLDANGYESADLNWLGADASTRRYGRLKSPDGRGVLLMDSPPQSQPPCPSDANEVERQSLGWYATTRLAASRVDAFVLIAEAIRSLGLSAPNVFAYDVEAGLCLLEDFGPHREFSHFLKDNPVNEQRLYLAAVEALAHIHTNLPAKPDQLKNDTLKWPLLEFDALAMRASMDVFYEWYIPYSGADTRPPLVAWESARDDICAHAEAIPHTFCFRDYHSQNLLWLPEREGMARVGLLDFQDAIIGWNVWDLDLLLRDARRKIRPETRQAALTHYCDLTGTDMSKLLEHWGVIGTLNALRIVGVYARLIKRDNKPQYVNFMPEQIRHLKAHLKTPKVNKMHRFIQTHFEELLR